MTRYFCDGCGQEITPKNEASGGHHLDSRLGIAVEKGGHKLRVEIIQTMDDVGNAGLFCKYCILDALNALDDRPRAAMKP